MREEYDLDPLAEEMAAVEKVLQRTDAVLAGVPRPDFQGRTSRAPVIYDPDWNEGQRLREWQACHQVMSEIKARFNLEVEQFIIESNLSNDKKVSYNNFMYGRGTRAVAECRLPGDVTKRFLHVSPEKLVRGYHSLAAGGMVGININIANMVAAIFASTGQDIASVHGSGIGHLTLDLTDNGNTVYASRVLPSLLIGTVGGGTRLPVQSKCLQLLGC